MIEIADETRRLYKRICNYNLHTRVCGDYFTAAGYTLTDKYVGYQLSFNDNVLFVDRNYKKVVCFLINRILEDRMEDKFYDYCN